MAILISNQEQITYGHQVVMETVICCTCGVPFAMPQQLRQHFKKSQDYFHCPNGHPQHYSKSTETELKEKIQRLESSISRKDDTINSKNQTISRIERQKSAIKGQVTRIKNRVKNGVCPCCNRTFSNLANHMKNQHPEFNP